MGVYRDRTDGKWVAAKMHKGRRLQQKFTTKRAADLKYSQFVREMELTDSLGQDKVDHITFDDVLRKGLKVMDTTAFTLSQENKLPIIVFDMNKKGNLRKVVTGENIGTVVNL